MLKLATEQPATRKRRRGADDDDDSDAESDDSAGQGDHGVLYDYRKSVHTRRRVRVRSGVWKTQQNTRNRGRVASRVGFGSAANMHTNYITTD